MNETVADKLELRTGVRAVQSDLDGLYYFCMPGDKRIAVGAAGVVILTLEQAYAVAHEILDVYDMCVRGCA